MSFGEVLANGFLKHGPEVMRRSRDLEKLATWEQKSGAKAFTGDFAATAKFADIIELAVKGNAAGTGTQRKFCQSVFFGG